MNDSNDCYNAGNFVVCMNLNKVLSYEKLILVKNSYSCYCYTLSGISKQPEFFRIHNKNDNIKVQDVINHLVDINYMPCNHTFLESIHQVTNVQFELFWGS